MFANQRKCSQAVIELGASPLGGLMACSTIFAKLSLVDILPGVTGEAISRRIFVDPIDVTGLASRVDM